MDSRVRTPGAGGMRGHGSYGLQAWCRDGPPASELTSGTRGSFKRRRWASEVPARESGLASLLKTGIEIPDARVRHSERLGLPDSCPGAPGAAAAPHLGRGESGPRCGAGGGRPRLPLPLAAARAHILFPPAGGRGCLPARPPSKG